MHQACRIGALGSLHVYVLGWCIGLVWPVPVHTTHQSSTYNTPFQYIHVQHTSPTQDGWVSSKIKNGVAVSPENSVAVSPENRKGILA